MSDWQWDPANMLATPNAEQQSSADCCKRHKKTDAAIFRATAGSCNGCKAGEQEPLKRLQAQQAADSKDYVEASLGRQMSSVRVNLLTDPRLDEPP